MGSWTTIRYYENETENARWGYAETGKYEIPRLTLLLACADNATFLHQQTAHNRNDFTFRVKLPLISVHLLLEKIYSSVIRLLRTPQAQFQRDFNLHGHQFRRAIGILEQALQRLAFFSEQRDLSSFFGLLSMLRGLSQLEPAPAYIVIDAGEVQTMGSKASDPCVHTGSNKLQAETSVLKGLVSSLITSDFMSMLEANQKLDPHHGCSRLTLGSHVDWVLESNAWMDKSTIGWAMIPDWLREEMADEVEYDLIGDDRLDWPVCFDAKFLTTRNSCLRFYHIFRTNGWR